MKKVLTITAIYVILFIGAQAFTHVPGHAVHDIGYPGLSLEHAPMGTGDPDYR